jgi:wyosine [tRNA(Phe)-imidazoG37] synthetase (radical SAM superfamily)
MQYVFGPVPSRRLGNSLGVDPVPLKTCNWNCVYCQLGRTTPVVNERRSFIPPTAIIQEVEQSLRTHRPGEIDWITFVGSGEPTLHSALGWMIRQVKALTNIPVAVLTNGSLLYRPEIREDLKVADAVLPSLDAGTAAVYRMVNRPHPECTFARFVEGLAAFRAIYRGRLWVEVMLVKALNDTEAALERIAAILSQVCPDEIHINSPVRPPAELWVAPAGPDELERACAILGRNARVVSASAEHFGLSAFTDPAAAVTAIVSRHPIEEQELIRALHRWKAGQIAEVLGRLAAGGAVQVVRRYGSRFWSSGKAVYPQAAGCGSVAAARRGIHRGGSPAR